MGFFKTMFASAAGFLIAAFLLFTFLFIAILSSSGEPEPYVKKNSILKIEISGSLPERPSDNPFDEIFSPGKVPVTLATLKNNLEKAAADERISGIWMEVEFLSASWPVLEELRAHMLQFRESGKFIYASTRDMGMNEQALYIATAADSVFAMNDTFIMNSGFYIQGTFFADMFDKIGIDAEVVSGGEFKTAGDSYIRTDFSEQDNIQLSAILESFTSAYTGALSEFSGKSTAEINDIMNRPPRITTRYALEDGLINGVMYPFEVEELIKNRIGVEEDRDLETISFERYSKVKRSSAGLERRAASDKIALIHASGIIIPVDESMFPGTGDPVITAGSFNKTLNEALDNDDVKAIVIRINSPGGSGTTSDLIWAEIRRAAEKKPVIASMGSVAASGGYYIAMAADTIVAQPTTVTGSIGVISAILKFGGLMEDELGITFDEVKSHEYADWFNLTRAFTPEEYQAFERINSDFYDVFTNKVALSRNMSVEDVLKVAGGRVWSGSDALNAGLVDVLGGTDTALDIAAQKAGLEAYSVETYPKPQTLFEMFSGSAQTQVRTWFTNMTPFPVQKAMDHAEMLRLLQRTEVLTIMPYQIDIR
ncbi:MAG: signal peptide peptidase SppA [Cyclonatronaceae bacterium]